MMVKIAIGTDLGAAKTVEIEWKKLSSLLSRHEESKRKGGKFFVGGHFTGTERREASMVGRSLLTLDADDTGMTLDDIELQLTMGLDCSFAAYTTYNHSAGKPKLRIVVPLSREVTPDEYRQLSNKIGDALGIPLDPCSYKPNQVMFMPSCPDLSLAWSMAVDGGPLQVDDHLVPIIIAAETDTDLDDAIGEQPLDLTDDQVKNYLRAYPAAALEYGEWIQVGAALHHQYQGNRDGMRLWAQWSKADADRYDKDAIASKWRSFGNSIRKTTFASIIYHVKSLGGIGAVATTNDAGATPFDELIAQCAAVTDRDAHRAMVGIISAMPTNALADSDRSLLATALHRAWAKGVGITKPDVKKAVRPPPATGGGSGGLPGWADNWVYLTERAEYYNTETFYGIKREAFNTKFASEPICILSNSSASTLVGSNPAFLKCNDTMYWPGAAGEVYFDGNRYINICREDIAQPCATVDADGQAVIDLFLAHTALLLPDPNEQKILLDWLAYVLQHPGKRVNWGVLLQGAQGCGKSYFSTVMQGILGRNMRQLDSTVIAGRFTGWAHGTRLAVVEEIRISGTNKYEVLDKLKPFQTNDTISVEEKGRDARTVPNFTNYLLLTNHKDAVPLADGDRRYCVLFSALQSAGAMSAAFGEGGGTDKYFKRLFDGSERRIDALAHYLLNRTIGADFMPRGNAPMTGAKAQMTALAVSPEREALEDAIDTHRCSVINENIIDITTLSDYVEMEPGEPLPKGRTLAKILSEMGYEKIEKRITCNKTRRRHRIWVRPNQHPEALIEEVGAFLNDPSYVPF